MMLAGMRSFIRKHPEFERYRAGVHQHAAVFPRSFVTTWACSVYDIYVVDHLVSMPVCRHGSSATTAAPPGQARLSGLIWTSGLTIRRSWQLIGRDHNVLRSGKAPWRSARPRRPLVSAAGRGTSPTKWPMLLGGPACFGIGRREPASSARRPLLRSWPALLDETRDRHDRQRSFQDFATTLVGHFRAGLAQVDMCSRNR